MTVAHKRNVQLVHPFTRDRAEVAAGLARLKEMTTDGQITDAERKRVHRAIFLTNEDTKDLDMITAFNEIKSFIQQRSLEMPCAWKPSRASCAQSAGAPGFR